MVAFGHQNEAINHLIKEAQKIGPKDILTVGAYGLNAGLRLVLFPVNLILVPPFTFVLGILTMITFGLLLMILSLVWFIFFGFIIGSSWLWIKAPLARPILFLPGVLIVLVSDIYVSLIPDMGEKYQKLIKLALCDSWPFSLLVYRLSLNIEQPEE
jgi:hypothetical protein